MSFGNALWAAACLSLDDPESGSKSGAGGATGVDGAAGWPGDDGAADGSGNGCDAGLTLCSGTCVDLQKSSSHCGQCDKLCKEPTPNCVLGACECPEPWGQICNGKCKDTKSDELNCGACEFQCAAGYYCKSGQCCTSC